MGRLDILPFKPPIRDDEFCVAKLNQVDYYFVTPGFFKLRHNLNGLLFTILTILAAIGFHQVFVLRLWTFLIISNFYTVVASIGLTGGSHRLWAHRAFEAKWPLRLFLMLSQASGGIWSIKSWYINHTVHHKWTDTDADPHNASRGLFFAHGFFQFKLQHPLNAIKEKTIDTTQLMSDPIVKFQYDNFEVLFIVFGMFLPTISGVIVTDDWSTANWINSFLICYAMKHFAVSHLSSFINSAAHLFGDRPYNVKILPGDNKTLAIFTVGEGYHNFHHAFPNDYATGEYGSWSLLTYFIEVMAACGQAFNLKRTSNRVIELTKNNNLRRQHIADYKLLD